LPDKGVDGLPKNFFIEQMKDVANMARGECERCCDGGTVSAAGERAVKYCVKCKLRLCEACVVVHGRLAGSRGHRLIGLVDNVDLGAAATETKTFSCDKHPTRQVEMYCFNCREASCLMCLVGLHQSHEYTDVNKVVDEFRQQMTSDIDNMMQTIKNCLDVVKVQEQKMDDFSNIVGEIEEEICKQVEKLKEMIDLEKRKLIQELISHKTEKLQRMQRVIEDAEQRLPFLESLINYTEELRDQGAANDVVQQAKVLHDRADELINLDDIHSKVNDLGSMQVSFEAGRLFIEATDCLLGHVKWQHVAGSFFFYFYLCLLRFVCIFLR
jgi:hypothetical protein